ncbi:type III secretion system HrpP C-terminal domain-containing protein [Serratia marcescens]|uniref:type III secretion system HrpP C-terminal domain-containing protein n=1 Tax=Serratia marcescens TaxID=615 RepID=UPI0029D5D850|nr:hypothetical protein [Serratia marcescens]
MISLTQQECCASRERAKEWGQEQQRLAVRQLHDGHHPLRQARLEKNIARVPERGCAAAERPAFTVRRDEEGSEATSNGDLFSMLMEHDTPAFPGVFHATQHAATMSLPAATQESARTGASMVLWQALENELDRALVNPPTGPVSVSLLLPRLGYVDVRVQALPAGGWDIALRFTPTVLDALAAHEERCRNSLCRRLACRVRLRFELREERA